MRALLALLLAACTAAPPALCPEGDDCPDPYGGWEALRQRTRDTAAAVDPAAAGADTTCSAHTDGRRYCTLSVPLPGHWLIVTCWQTTAGDVDCTWFFG